MINWTNTIYSLIFYFVCCLSWKGNEMDEMFALILGESSQSSEGYTSMNDEDYE